MEILIFILLTTVFFYSLRKFVRDDYIFIRKNISLEQIFDIGFGTLWIGLIFARMFYFVFHTPTGENLLFLFFSFGKGGLSLTGGVIGGILGLFLISKYKKVPLGRIFDFFTLPFLLVLPLGLISHLPFVKGPYFFVFLFLALLYFVLMFLFIRLLYPNILNKTIREGNLSCVFFICFFLISFVYSLVSFNNSLLVLKIQVESIVLGICLLLSIGILIRYEMKKVRKK